MEEPIIEAPKVSIKPQKKEKIKDTWEIISKPGLLPNPVSPNKKLRLLIGAIIGFFIATMWSIIISLALNSVLDNHGSFSGILVTGIIGGAFIPLVVGAIGDSFGLKTGMLFL